jgi:ribonuclease E
MSNMETPAGGAGGDATTPTQVELAELPAKVRVHALARLLGASSREVLTALDEIGESVRSPQSTVSRAVALRVAEALLPDPQEPGDDAVDSSDADSLSARPVPPAPLFLPPQAAAKPPPSAPAREEAEEAEEPARAGGGDNADTEDDDSDDDDAGRRRRRRRGRRGRGRGRGGQGEDGSQAEDSGEDEDETSADEQAEDEQAEQDDGDKGDDNGTKRRRRRRRRKGTGGQDSSGSEDDPPNTVVHVRESREGKAEAPAAQDEVRSVRGSTRLEAKRQRRRDGREAGRRRVPVVSEAEFLARRESVDRRMVVRERGDQIQIGVLEDDVLVEHFVTSAGSGSLVGNVYLGRVQNVLPSMEAAFVDIGRGRNAVLYAGEVDWDAAGLEGKARKIEQALSTGDSVLVQVTKDPVGHKGARLTTQISLPGRFLVYVPGGGVTGISRKLPDTERKRLKEILRRIVPDEAGVIIRTASEGISEEELDRDVRRLQAQWEVIKDKAEQPGAKAPQLLYEEPDLLIKVVRDMFTEDFSELVVQGGDAWDTINAYVQHVAPDLVARLRRHVANVDVFTEYRIDEQLAKALDRKVWLPSGGYLVVDRTEAMTVIDVNTGKFTGSGGNLEETVTRNNLEAAEEIVRQLRLRDLGGIIVIDFIDMVLESNRDLVLRRLTECLGRDRTRHQVAEVTSLGLVQMTRKRVGTGLLEAFSTTCEHCRGRGVTVSTEPVHSHGGGGQGGGQGGGGQGGGGQTRKSRRGRSSEPETPPESAAPAAPAPSPEPASESGRRTKRAARREAGAPAAARSAVQSEVVVTAPAEPAPSAEHAPAAAPAHAVEAAPGAEPAPAAAEPAPSAETAAAVATPPPTTGPADAEPPSAPVSEPSGESSGSAVSAGEPVPADTEGRSAAGGAVDHTVADAGTGAVAGSGEPAVRVTGAEEPAPSPADLTEPAPEEPAQAEADVRGTAPLAADGYAATDTGASEVRDAEGPAVTDTGVAAAQAAEQPAAEPTTGSAAPSGGAPSVEGQAPEEAEGRSEDTGAVGGAVADAGAVTGAGGPAEAGQPAQAEVTAEATPAAAEHADRDDAAETAPAHVEAEDADREAAASGPRGSGEPEEERSSPFRRNGRWPEHAERDDADDRQPAESGSSDEQSAPVAEPRRPGRRAASRPAGPPLGAVREQ